MSEAIHADHPKPGYYKLRRGRDKPWQPVAIWSKENALVCRVGSEMADPLETWTWCAANPITKEAAKFAFENGRFPDDPEPLSLRNMPADPFEALKVEIEDRAAQAREWLKAHPEIKTQEDCNLARNMQAQLLALEKQADQDRETEKRPHFLASKAVDAKFKPLVVMAADCAKALRGAFEAFLRAEERRERERVETERQRIERQHAVLMADDPVAALTSPPPEMPEPSRVQAGGGFGRKVGLKSVWVGTVKDYNTTLAHFAGNAKIKELVQKLVDQAVRAGDRSIPGCAITEERRVA
jgi:hypothetical protein